MVYRRESFDPAISPDGRYVAFHSLDRHDWQQWLQRLQTGSDRLVYNLWIFDTLKNTYYQVTRGGGRSPSWSPDGKSIVYVFRSGNTTQLRVMNVEKLLSGAPSPGEKDRQL